MKLKGTVIRPLDKQVNTEPSLVPKAPFSMYLSASKGQGKSTVLLNLLLSDELLSNKFNQIYIISPTNKLDEKMQVLKETKGIVKVNKPLLKKLKEKGKIKILDDNLSHEGSYETSIPDINFIDEVKPDLLKTLIAEQKSIIQAYGKSYSDHILLVYDDTISFKKFWNSESVQQLFFNSRHYKISIIITSQNYKSLPKALRLNMSQMLLYFTANQDELKNIYIENSSSLGFKKFEQIYRDTCQSKAFHFLVINYQNPVENRLQSGFEKFVEI